MVSEKHANFVINRGGATASEVTHVIEHVRKSVFNNYGIKLQLEVVIIDENGKPVSLEDLES